MPGRIPEEVALERIDALLAGTPWVRLGTSYPGAHRKIRFRCEKHHQEFLKELSELAYRSGCPRCGREVIGQKKRLTEAEVIARGRRYGLALRSPYSAYRGNTSRLKWLDPEGHEFRCSISKLGETLCPRCTSRLNIGEEMVRRCFEHLYGLEFPNCKPKWLDGLQLDGYNASLRLAFEAQGGQHFVPTSYLNKDPEAFRGQLRRDQAKRDLCKRANVRLVEIPLIKRPVFGRVWKSVLLELERAGLPLPPNSTIEPSLDNLYTSNSIIRRVRAKIEANGGRLLSKSYNGHYNKIRAICGGGHTFQALPYNILKGHWCARCAGKMGDQKSIVREIIAKLAANRNSTKGRLYAAAKTEIKARTGQIVSTKFVQRNIPASLRPRVQGEQERGRVDAEIRANRDTARVAARLGITRKQVNRRRRELGLETDIDRWNTTKALALERVGRAKSHRELGLSRTTFERLLAQRIGPRLAQNFLLLDEASGARPCINCAQWRPLEDFRTRKDKPRVTECRECERKDALKRLHDRQGTQRDP